MRARPAPSRRNRSDVDRFSCGLIAHVHQARQAARLAHAVTGVEIAPGVRRRAPGAGPPSGRRGVLSCAVARGTIGAAEKPADATTGFRSGVRRFTECGLMRRRGKPSAFSDLSLVDRKVHFRLRARRGVGNRSTSTGFQCGVRRRHARFERESRARQRFVQSGRARPGSSRRARRARSEPDPRSGRARRGGRTGRAPGSGQAEPARARAATLVNLGLEHERGEHARARARRPPRPRASGPSRRPARRVDTGACQRPVVGRDTRPRRSHLRGAPVERP